MPSSISRRTRTILIAAPWGKGENPIASMALDPSAAKATEYHRVPSAGTEGDDENVRHAVDEETGVDPGTLGMGDTPKDIHPLEMHGEMKSMKIASDEEPSEEGMFAQVKLFLGIALPTMVIQSSILGLGTMTTSYVGQHIGRHALTGFSVSNLAANLLGNSLIFGMLSGLETLAPQAMGAGRYAEVGFLAQTSAVLCFVLMFLIFLIYWNAAPILHSLKQPEDSIQLASRFLRVYCLALPSDILYNVIRRFLWCQNIVAFFMVISVVVLAIHRFYLYLFITWAGLGFDGAAVAHVASSFTQLVLSLIYAATIAPYKKETWSGFKASEAFSPKRLKACLKLGIPGILANNEWWYWECVCVLAGELGELELASHTIAYNVVPLAFMLPLGLAIAVTTRVGNLLAQNKLKKARMMSYFALFGALLAGICSFSVSYFVREPIIAAFAGNDQEVYDLTEKIWIYVCFFVVVDSFNGTIAGVFRGLAAQFYLSAVMFTCLWLIGIPTMYVWSFNYGHGLVGIWQVMLYLYFFLIALQVFVCYFWIDWTKVIEKSTG